MRRINVRFLIILSVVALGITAGTLLLYRFQSHRRTAGLLTLVAEKEKSKEMDEAITFLTRYVAVNPKDYAQLKRLGLLVKKRADKMYREGTLDERNFTFAYRTLEEAVRKNPSDVQIREATVAFMTKFGRFTDAIDHLKELERIAGDKAKPDWKIQLARLYHSSGRTDEALPYLNQLVGWDSDTRTFDTSKALAPQEVDAYITLAILLQQQFRDPEVSEKILNQMLEQSPNSANAHILYGRLLPQFKPGVDAKALAKEMAAKAMQIDSENIDSLTYSAEVALEENDLVRSKALLERTRELFPKSIRPFVGLYQWAIQQKRPTDAINYLKQGLKLDPKNSELVWRMASLQLDQNKLEEFNKSLATYRALKANPAIADFLEGARLRHDGEWLRAAKVLSGVRGQLENSRPELLESLDRQLVAVYDRLGQTDLQLAAIDRLISARPDDLPLRMARIQGLLAMRQEEKALEEYARLERIFESKPELAKPFLLQRFQLELLAQGRRPKDDQSWDQAEQLAREISDQKNVTAEVKAALIAEYYDKRGDTERATALRTQAESGAAGSQAGDFAEAKRVIYEDSPAEAQKKLDALSKQYGDVLGVRLLQAELILKERPEDLPAQFQKLENPPDSYSEVERLQLWAELGRYQLFANHRDEAQRLWSKVLEKDRDNVTLRLQLFELALADGDEQRVADQLKDIERIFSQESPEWMWASAAQTMVRIKNKKSEPDDLDNALSKLDAAILKRPNWNLLYILKGELQGAQNRPDLAAASLEKAVELGAINPLVLRNLLRIYYESNRYADSQRILDKLPESTRTEYERRIQLHLLAMQQAIPEKLQLEDYGDNAEGFSWLGQLLTDAKRYDDAEKAFRKALELEPDYAAAWSGLVLIPLRQGDKEKAAQLVQDAESKIAERSRPSFMAVMHRMLGDYESAEKYYLQVLEKSADDLSVRRDIATFYLDNQQLEKATPQLARILRDAKPHAADAPAPVLWARRTQAELVARDGTYQGFQKAIALIRENVPEGGVISADDLILWSQLALQRHDHETYQAAVDQHVKAAETRATGFREAVYLADLYKRLGKWNECQRVMTDLLVANPNELSILDPWLRWLLENDDLRSAAQWVKNCPPGSMAAIRTNIHIAARRRDTERATELLTQLVNAPGTPQEKEPALLAAATIAEEIGAFDPKFLTFADGVWKKVIQANRANVNNVVNYAIFLGRSGNPANAPVLEKACELLVKEGRAAEAIRPAIATLRRFGDKMPNRAEFESKLRTWLEVAAKTNPPIAKMLLAETESVLGNYEAQVERLKEFLEEFPDKNNNRAIVLNNLAYVSAVLGRGAEALTWIDQAEEILGPASTLRDTRGMAYLAQGEAKKASDEFQYAIDHGETSGLSYAHLATALWQMGEKDRAVEAMTRAQEGGLQRSFSESEVPTPERDALQKLLAEMKAAGLMTEPVDTASDIETSTR